MVTDFGYHSPIEIYDAAAIDENASIIVAVHVEVRLKLLKHFAGHNVKQPMHVYLLGHPDSDICGLSPRS